MSGDGGGDENWKRGGENWRAETQLPVRMLIPTTCVGAVLGQKGRVIRGITKDSGARLVLEVGRSGHPSHGPPSYQDRVMTIWGGPEECSKAVGAVQMIVTEELEKARNGDGTLGKGKESNVELRLRGRHELIGRLIGKGGEQVKAMMAATNATVSCAQELHPVFSNGERWDAYGREGEVLERTIAIRGTMEAVIACEVQVSAALREAWRNFSPRQSHSPSYGNMALHLPPHPHPQHMPYVSPLMPPYLAFPPLPLNANLVTPLPADSLNQIETVHLYVPSSMVGLLIGPKGAHIRNLMRVTGAQVRVEGAGKAARATQKEEADTKEEEMKTKKEEMKEEETAEQAEEAKPRRRGSGSEGSMRCVVIIGGAESQLRAQFWIYQRVCECRQSYFDDVKLTVECPVPVAALGRVIGRQGQQLKELQRMTNAELHILKPADPEDTQHLPLLRIAAPFNASQACQTRLRQILYQFYSSKNYQLSNNGNAPQSPNPSSK